MCSIPHHALRDVSTSHSRVEITMSGDQPATRRSGRIQPTARQGRVFQHALLRADVVVVTHCGAALCAYGAGVSATPRRLNLAQALLIMALAGFIFVIMLSLNGQPGLKYGIPFPIQARTAFGVRGSKIIESCVRCPPSSVRHRHVDRRTRDGWHP